MLSFEYKKGIVLYNIYKETLSGFCSTKPLQKSSQYVRRNYG